MSAFFYEIILLNLKQMLENIIVQRQMGQIESLSMPDLLLLVSQSFALRN